jgi:hypothetical protein
MLTIGIVIAGSINDAVMDEYQIYNTALHIDNDKNLFEYGMRTDIGNAFVYGDLEAIDTVTYPEIGGSYMYVLKIKERYTKHTRTYTTTDSKGKTQVHTETYWTWDEVGRESVKCQEVSFCDVVFDSDKINTPGTYYLETIKESSKIRYKYYVTDVKHTGTIFTSLQNDTISDGTNFYNNKTINETIEYLESGCELIIFWIVWVVLTGGIVYGFYYIDNKWLEDKNSRRMYY